MLKHLWVSDTVIVLAHDTKSKPPPTFVFSWLTSNKETHEKRNSHFKKSNRKQREGTSMSLTTALTQVHPKRRTFKSLEWTGQLATKRSGPGKDNSNFSLISLSFSISEIGTVVTYTTIHKTKTRVYPRMTFVSVEATRYLPFHT